MVLSKKFKICAALYAGLNLAVCADDINAWRKSSTSADHNPAAHSYTVQLPHMILQNEAVDNSPLGAIVAMASISTVITALPGFFTGEAIGKTLYKPAP